MQLPNNVKGFELINTEKVERALLGRVGRAGELTGGVQQPDGSYDDDALLSAYDKLGGLIMLNGDKVKTGSFYDFGAKAPRVKPEVMLEFRVNGRVVDVPAEAELPTSVKAVKLSAEMDKAEAETKAKEKASKKRK